MKRLIAAVILTFLFGCPAWAQTSSGISNPGMYPLGTIIANDLVTYKDTSGIPTKDPGIGVISGRITPVGDPVNPLDAANKEYVDNAIGGLVPVTGGPAVVGTTANLTATYANGAAGVGATLTNSGTQAAFSADGVSPAINSRVLVKDQVTQFQNGIFTLTTVGTGATNWVLTRATDFDQATSTEVAFGATVALSQGTTQAGQVWFESCPGPFTIGTTAICFSKFGAGAPALTNNHIFVGTAGNLAGDVAMFGDCTIIASGAILCTKINGQVVAFPLALGLGGTHADLSATGGTGQVLQQASVGADITVGALPFSNLSGSVACSQEPAFTGDISTSSGSCVTTLATVNSNVGTFQGITVNAKGLVTAASNQNYLSNALTSAHLFVGNAGNVATDVAASGDLTVANTGAFILNNVATAGTQAGITWSTKGLVTAGGPGQVNLGTSDGVQFIPNNSVATVLHKLAIVATGTYQATVALVGSTTNVVGICDGTCGNSGSATIAWGGSVQCVFDGATTAGDWVDASTTVAGDCHDAGATVPTTVQVLGQVESTNGGAGTYFIDLNPVGVASAINSKSSPGGTSGQIQWNSAGNFAGFTASGGATINTSTGVVTLANPSASTLGGIESFAAVSHQWINTISTSGVPSSTQPAVGDLASIAANTYLGNPTSGSAAPAATAVASCSGNNHAEQYTTNTGFTCAADITNLDVADQTVTGGANVTVLAQSAGNLTVDCGARPAQYIPNTGAFTLTAPANDGYCYLDVENGAGAGAIALSGFAPNTMGGAAPDTTNGHNFRLVVSRVHGHANVFSVALQ